MAKKQIIWSGFAKKKLYAFLERQIEESNNKESAKLLFAAIVFKLTEVLNSPGLGSLTSEKNITASIVDKYLVIYELTSSVLIVHTVSEWATGNDPRD